MAWWLCSMLLRIKTLFWCWNSLNLSVGRHLVSKTVYCWHLLWVFCYMPLEYETGDVYLQDTGIENLEKLFKVLICNRQFIWEIESIRESKEISLNLIKRGLDCVGLILTINTSGRISQSESQTRNKPIMLSMSVVDRGVKWSTNDNINDSWGRHQLVISWVGILKMSNKLAHIKR